MRAFSTCWNNHRHREGEPIAEEIRQLGFDTIEVSHGTRLTLLPGLTQAVKDGIVSVCSVHHPCPSPVELLHDAPDAYQFSDELDSSRNRAIKHAEKSLETACQLGAKRMVVHLGTVPIKPATDQLEAEAKSGGLFGRSFTHAKLDLIQRRQAAVGPALGRSIKAIETLIPLAEKHGVRIGVETRSHHEQIPTLEELSGLLDQFPDCPWVGSWHDFGHVQRQANLGFVDHAQALRGIAPRLLGCHVHDVGWPDRDHRAPLSTGGVEFQSLLPLVPTDVPLVWEMSPSQSREAILRASEAWNKLMSSTHARSIKDTDLRPSAA
jgi:sugar phosphate isomerase/epimerase